MASESTRSVVLAGLAGTAALAVVKLFAVSQSASSVLMASAVHSLIDMSSLALLLYGLSHTPTGSADRQLAFWSFVVAILLYAFAAGVVLLEAIESLSRPKAANANWPDLAILAFGAVVSGGIGWLALRRLQATRAAGLPLSEMMRRPGGWPMLAVLIQATAAMGGHVVTLTAMSALHNGADNRIDGAATLMVGLILVAVAAAMAIEVKRVLAGSALSERLRGGAKAGEAVSPIPLPVAGAGPGHPTPAPETKSMPDPQQPLVELPAPPSTGRLAADPSPGGQKPAVQPRPNGKKGHGKRRR